MSTRRRTRLLCVTLLSLLSITAGTLPAQSPTEGLAPTVMTLDVPGATETVALDISPNGDIVGRYDVDLNGALTTHGFLRTRHGEWVSIDYPGANFTVAAAINALGDIVGTYRLVGEPLRSRHGFLLTQGNFTTIDPPGAVWTNPLGLDALGRVVGRYCTSVARPCSAEENSVHAFLFDAGGFTTFDFPGASATNAWKITPRGWILGAYRAEGHNHPFLLTDAGFTTVDVPPVAAISADNGGMNPQGDIVLSFCDSEPCTARTPSHGLLLNRAGFSAVDVPGALSTVMFSINPSGHMVGFYTDLTRRSHGLLILP